MLKKFRLSAEDWMLGYKKKFLADDGLHRLTMCKKCYTFYYKNAWHFEKPQLIEEGRQEEIVVHFAECPACMEEELALCEMESNLSLV